MICHDVLEQMLEEKVGELNMYARDRKRIYDAEMQNRNHQGMEVRVHERIVA